MLFKKNYETSNIDQGIRTLNNRGQTAVSFQIMGSEPINSDMAVLIFKLSYVPDDEAQDIRELLSGNDIDYYETSAGVFGISVPGLWLKSKDQVEITWNQKGQTQLKREFEWQTSMRFWN